MTFLICKSPGKSSNSTGPSSWQSDFARQKCPRIWGFLKSYEMVHLDLRLGKYQVRVEYLYKIYPYIYCTYRVYMTCEICYNGIDKLDNDTICVYLCIYSFIIHTDTLIQTYSHIYIYIYNDIYIYIDINICTCICIHICIYIYILYVYSCNEWTLYLTPSNLGTWTQ